MRISDWSSDVCSSDLHDHRDARRRNGSAHAFESAGGNRLRPRRDRPGAVGSAGDGQSANGGAARSPRRWPPADEWTHPATMVRTPFRSEEHKSEIQSLMRYSVDAFSLNNKNLKTHKPHHQPVRHH